MSLDWDITNVPDHEENCWIPTGETRPDGTPTVRLHPVTEMLIFATMIVGMREITKTNADKFYARVYTEERLSGSWLIGPNGEQAYITPAQVWAHIGLRTNASEYTDVAWRAKLARTATERAGRKWRKFEAQAAEQTHATS